MIENYNILKLYGVDKRNSSKAEEENESLFDMYLNRLVNLALNRFEWINLPFSIDERFLEMTLCYLGKGVGFKNETNEQLMFTQVIGTSELNVYHNPVNFEAYGVGGFMQSLNIDTGVICYNDYTRTPTANYLIEYAKRLADIQRTIDVHLTNHKVPSVWLAPKHKMSTLRNLFSKIKNNEPVIYGDETLVGNGTSLGVLGNPTEFIIDKLEIEKKQIWNEAMNYLGIDNANQDKKERLVAQEVESNNGQIEQARYVSLNTRRIFCKKFNLMFGTDIWCDFRHNQDKTRSEEEVLNEEENSEVENEYKEIQKEREVI